MKNIKQTLELPKIYVKEVLGVQNIIFTRNQKDEKSVEEIEFQDYKEYDIVAYKGDALDEVLTNWKYFRKGEFIINGDGTYTYLLDDYRPSNIFLLDNKTRSSKLPGKFLIFKQVSTVKDLDDFGNSLMIVNKETKREIQYEVKIINLSKHSFKYNIVKNYDNLYDGFSYWKANKSKSPEDIETTLSSAYKLHINPVDYKFLRKIHYNFRSLEFSMRHIIRILEYKFQRPVYYIKTKCQDIDYKKLNSLTTPIKRPISTIISAKHYNYKIYSIGDNIQRYSDANLQELGLSNIINKNFEYVIDLDFMEIKSGKHDAMTTEVYHSLNGGELELIKTYVAYESSGFKYIFNNRPVTIGEYYIPEANAIIKEPIYNEIIGYKLKENINAKNKRRFEYLISKYKEPQKVESYIDYEEWDNNYTHQYTGDCLEYELKKYNREKNKNTKSVLKLYQKYPNKPTKPKSIKKYVEEYDEIKELPPLLQKRLEENHTTKETLLGNLTTFKLLDKNIETKLITSMYNVVKEIILNNKRYSICELLPLIADKLKSFLKSEYNFEGYIDDSFLKIGNKEAIKQGFLRSLDNDLGRNVNLNPELKWNIIYGYINIFVFDKGDISYIGQLQITELYAIEGKWYNKGSVEYKRVFLANNPNNINVPMNKITSEELFHIANHYIQPEDIFEDVQRFGKIFDDLK